MRGKGRLRIVGSWKNRITPAYAGKRLPSLPIYRSTAGSPPRMRGKAVAPLTKRQKSGITPAYAGKSENHIKRYPPLWDHPRVCGEKNHLPYKARMCKGSPPRMRGKDTAEEARRKGIGITPAYAGKRKRGADSPHSRRDHPRVCGEKCVHADHRNTWQGSPPRMRGKANLKQWFHTAQGITPAYAGKRYRITYLG